MRVGDAFDRLAALISRSEYPVRFGAVAALSVACEQCAAEFQGIDRQMSGEAIANVRASLELALAALDEARVQCPSGPVHVVAPEYASAETSRG